MNGEKRHAVYGMCVFLVIGMVIGAIVGIAIYVLAHPAFQSIEGAAWVQAIGSILAVVAAIFISTHQAKRTRENQEEIRRAQLDGVVSIARLASGTAVKQRKVFQDKEKYPDYEKMRKLCAPALEELALAFSGVDFHQAPYAYVAQEAINMKITLQRIARTMREDMEVNRESMVKALASVGKQLSKNMKTIRAISADYNGASVPDLSEIRARIEQEHNKKNTGKL
jgi:hypothetical protein